eukprot:CAMPEP_0201283470 /NCGR_PEP_ID=MMETSP1317-20130820/8630_1 /ASSEMBLY_ACC=CAM_ASM_000770 /TAXON_ID=187299 /ORGANISM="Undescribed Undescribed, Strain Undescribed" /LENGTH=108 /DNA_ID=CAMNT_0047599801 /DNA_START=625 /DNA_END=951 /DNA_ORIENTATION=+
MVEHYRGNQFSDRGDHFVIGREVLLEGGQHNGDEVVGDELGNQSGGVVHHLGEEGENRLIQVVYFRGEHSGSRLRHLAFKNFPDGGSRHALVSCLSVPSGQSYFYSPE